ncbi:hypothetical protein J0692_04685 [Vibrio alginolyticus]|uniref:hypothetical protein n=1 Tax=Vibrio alginolyticus TaxID=663 RepID=UPI001A8DA58A|nr:hypothetical protein [Vibrio alginolyticus]MBO0161523.1 hypothetical protein [Vibrio alginolyticus]
MSNTDVLLKQAISASLEQTEASQTLASVVNQKMAGIEKSVSDAQKKAQSTIESVADNLGFMAINYNADMKDIYVSKEPNKQGVINQVPLGWGVKPDLLDCCHFEMIPVTSGSTPSERHEEARALLDFMGIGADTKHWSGSFNILKIKVLDTSFIQRTGYDAHIADQHLRQDPATSFLRYVKVIGKTSVGWLGGDTNDQWVQHRSVVKSTPGSARYTHVDLVFSDKTEIGDVVMIALPSVVPGIWPENRKHSRLYNLKDHFTKVIAQKHV